MPYFRKKVHEVPFRAVEVRDNTPKDPVSAIGEDTCQAIYENPVTAYSTDDYQLAMNILDLYASIFIVFVIFACCRRKLC